MLSATSADWFEEPLEFCATGAAWLNETLGMLSGAGTAAWVDVRLERFSRTGAGWVAEPSEMLSRTGAIWLIGPLKTPSGVAWEGKPLEPLSGTGAVWMNKLTEPRPRSGAVGADEPLEI